MPKAQRPHSRPAVAACAFEVSSATAQVQLLPAGRFRAVDGRPFDAESWRLDAETADRVIARTAAKANQVVIDYEHQSLHADVNGQPAPAAGWFKQLAFRPDSGLWATDVEWTERASAMIGAGEYRYISAVFAYLPESGEILQILNAGLTNTPALDGLAELTLAAAAKFSLHTSEEDTTVNPELLKLLGLQKDASDEAIQQAVTALKTKADETGEDGVGRNSAAYCAACTAELPAHYGLRPNAPYAATPDPAKYVPVQVVEDLRGEIAALRTHQTEGEVDTLVTGALSDGRLLPAQEQWARGLGQSNLAALRQYIETAQPIAALRGSQTQGKAPEGEDKAALSEAQTAICRRLGLDEADYRAASAKE